MLLTRVEHSTGNLPTVVYAEIQMLFPRIEYSSSL